MSGVVGILVVGVVGIWSLGELDAQYKKTIVDLDNEIAALKKAAAKK